MIRKESIVDRNEVKLYLFVQGNHQLFWSTGNEAGYKFFCTVINRGTGWM